MCDGRPLHPLDAAQHWGLQISATGRSGATAEVRARKASAAHAHHAPKVFRNGFIPIQFRAPLWLTLARAIA
eukprot:6722829-Pyramimonas_sp.AAC.1